MRLFVALDLPDPVKERLARIIAELSACGADVRWVHADSMHLTLKFLGDVEPRELAAIDETLSRVAGAARPTRARLRDIGSFPHLRRPRVLWAGVETGDESLAELHAATDATRPLGAFGPFAARFARRWQAGAGPRGRHVFRYRHRRCVLLLSP